MKIFAVASVLVVMLTLALLSGSWNNPFVLDDLTKIMQNLDLKTPFDFTTFIYKYAPDPMHYRNDPSRPLVYMAYWACWHLGRGAPWPFHILSTLLHALNAVLLMWWVVRFKERAGQERELWSGLIAGTLFATSPLMVGTAIYAFGLSDVLSTSLILACLLLLMSESAKPLKQWGGWFAFALALGCKQSAVVVALILPLMDLVMAPRSGWSARWRKIHLPIWAISAVYLLTRYFYFGAIGDIEGSTDVVPSEIYLLTQGAMILRYLQFIFWPFGLTIDHRPLPNALESWQWLSLWGMVALPSLAAVSCLLKTKSPRLWQWTAFGWLFFLICLLPTSSFLPTVDLLVERRAYTAGLGIFLIVGLLAGAILDRGRHWKVAVSMVMVGMVAAQCWFALDRVATYGAPELLWQEALRLDPENPRALINLSVHYSASGNWEESRKTLERLSQLQPQNGSIYSKLAFLYQQKNYIHYDLKRAEELFIKSLNLTPQNIFAHYNYGILLMEEKRWGQAEEHFLQALRIAPRMEMAAIAAGDAAKAAGNLEQAIAHFQEALRINSDSTVAHARLSQVENINHNR